MPILQVNLMEGRTQAQKEKLIAAVTAAVVESIGAPKESVRVLINEMPKGHFGIAGQSAEKLGR